MAGFCSFNGIDGQGAHGVDTQIIDRAPTFRFCLSHDDFLLACFEYLISNPPFLISDF
jgi:hypothetical protein